MYFKLELLVLVTTILYSIVDSRGPHHPRGEKVVKRHVHYAPTKTSGQNILQDKQLLHDKEHIQEHMEEMKMVEPDLSNMSDEELEFYYFQVHDSDKNLKLDGLEILQAIFHTMHHSDEEQDENPQQHVDTAGNSLSDLDYYVELIDKVLQEDDLDKDGYLDYVEYTQGKKKSAKEKLSTEQPSVQLLP